MLILSACIWHRLHTIYMISQLDACDSYSVWLCSYACLQLWHCCYKDTFEFMVGFIWSDSMTLQCTITYDIVHPLHSLIVRKVDPAW